MRCEEGNITEIVVQRHLPELWKDIVKTLLEWIAGLCGGFFVCSGFFFSFFSPCVGIFSSIIAPKCVIHSQQRTFNEGFKMQEQLIKSQSISIVSCCCYCHCFSKEIKEYAKGWIVAKQG